MINAPLLSKDNVPVSHLVDFRHDPQITEKPADEVNYVFVDTPTVPNGDVYRDHILQNFLCKFCLDSV